MPAPHYRQIERALRDRIATSSPGDRLPSDAELCAEFGVSRMTARHAMQRLLEDGLITREPGRGSYVATPPSYRRANRLMTFSQEMRRRGRIPSSRVLACLIRPSTAAEAATLGRPTGEPVVELRRLRLADGIPIALETAILIGACADAVLPADLVQGSLHEVLTEAGFVLRRGTGTISAVAATAEDARLLGIRSGSPLLIEQRVIADRHGQRIEATESRYPGDRYGLDVQFDVEGNDADPDSSGPGAARS
jgi:GntR family transcriptional regulator